MSRIGSPASTLSWFEPQEARPSRRALVGGLWFLSSAEIGKCPDIPPCILAKRGLGFNSLRRLVPVTLTWLTVSNIRHTAYTTMLSCHGEAWAGRRSQQPSLWPVTTAVRSHGIICRASAEGHFIYWIFNWLEGPPSREEGGTTGLLQRINTWLPNVAGLKICPMPPAGDGPALRLPSAVTSEVLAASLFQSTFHLDRPVPWQALQVRR
ncbi:predicted protein [Verticillium alfalfae VaMs.102]|uniref:Predicted protein n=1 Tax=Verticillium alfalfae (strain VaMs.102 / ATCC MYA-4576 / FGSC 10136) TaxID=526221 RepID=C9SIE0_VERA1|nr:predicted protein [Verticillium alfalfae VaMs.102]EEY18713.1 predicted protein [Verticillium alfalfae VaMs.102]